MRCLGLYYVFPNKMLDYSTVIFDGSMDLGAHACAMEKLVDIDLPTNL